MAYVVKRQTGRCKIYLAGFDLIWGPIWSISHVHAKQFASQTAADIALSDAADIMRPKRWCVPDYGSATTLWVDTSV